MLTRTYVFHCSISKCNLPRCLSRLSARDLVFCEFTKKTAGFLWNFESIDSHLCKELATASCAAVCHIPESKKVHSGTKMITVSEMMIGCLPCIICPLLFDWSLKKIGAHQQLQIQQNNSKPVHKNYESMTQPYLNSQAPKTRSTSHQTLFAW